MKKISLLFSVILLSLITYAGEWTGIKSEKPSAIQQKLLNSNEANIVIQFTIDGFYTSHVTTPRGKAVIISVPKMVSLSEVGAPDVPKYAVSSIIGDQADMDVRVITSKYVDYQNIEIAPSKGDFSRNIDPATVPFTYGSIYNNDAFYPLVNAELQEPYILRNYRGQAVTIMPFVYNPITKTLRVFYDLTIELFKTGTGGANQLTRNTNTNTADYEFKHIYSRQFINFQEATNRYPIVEEQGNLLIISHGPYMEAMQPFVEWKKTIGRPTQIVDVATIGTTSLAIRDYVLNYYNTNGLTHLIIVGDHQHVPSYNNTASGGYSDNYFGYLAGNDSYNEVFVGRFSAESVVHVQTQIQKVITYERDMDETDTWLSIGTGIARNEGAGNGHMGGEADYVHMDYIRDSLLNSTYTTVHREYDGGVPGLTNTTAAQISSRINAGTSIIDYCNHGSINSWSVAGYTTSHVNALTNVDRWPVMWIVACDNGQFTNGSCFAETWMRATSNGQPTGALGGMMSWISQPWQPPMTGQDEMVTILVEGYQNNIKRTLGGNSINGSMRMVDLHGSSGKSTHDTWILFGDPSMTMRTAAPVAMNVSHLPAIFLGMSDFTVNADAEGATVALTLNGEILGTGIISNGTTTITFPALSNVGLMKIAVLGYNKITYIQEIEIIPASGPFVAFVSNEVNGVATSQVNYNQTATLGVKLKNLGVAPASNVNVTLSCNSPFLTITDNSENYGTLQPEQIVMIANAFAITVSPDVPNNTPLEFNLNIVGDEATWTSSFNLTALAPSFSIGSYTISDPSGNGNGRLDPGETVNMKIMFTNDGSSQAGVTDGNLVFDSQYITVNTAAFQVATVDANQSVEAVFNITVNAGAPIGQIVNFTFDVQSGAYQAQKSFATKVGLVLDDFESGDFSAYPYTFNSSPWTISTTTPYEGTYTAKSGTITHNGTTQMMLQYEVSVNDTISFFRKVSSESGYDFMRFYIDNVKVGEWAGTVSWSKVSFPVTAGMRTFKWEYMKDGSVSSGDDCAYVDYILLPPTITTNGWAGDDAQVCAGESLQLNASAQHYTSILWTTTGSGTYSNTTILNPVYVPSEADVLAGNVSLKLTVTGASSTVESTMNLTINALPEATAGENAAICSGATFELSQATAENYSTLLWTTSGTGTFNDASIMHPTYTPSTEDYISGQVVLSLEANGLGSCGAATSQINLAFHPVPTAVLSGDQTICHGAVAEISFALTGAAPWTVEMADGMGTHSIPSSPWTMQVTPEQAVTYALLSVTDANSCANTASGHAVISMNFAPDAPVKPAAPDTVDHAFVTTSNISIAAVPNSESYAWELLPTEAGTITADGINATVAWNSTYTGPSSIKAAAINACGQSVWSEAKDVVVKSTVGIAENNIQNLHIYPNPSTGNFTLIVDQSSSNTSTIMVSNMVGELVYTKTIANTASKSTIEMQLDYLPNGVYMIRVESGKSLSVQRFTIKK